MWRRGGDWWRLWTESRAVCAAAPVQTPPGLPSGDTPGAGSGAGVVGGETASPAAAWQPSADALPAAPSDAPFSPPSEYMSGIGFGAEVATRETGSAASTSAPSDSAVGADCGVVAAASAAVGAPPAGAPLDSGAGAGRRGGAALASIAIGFRLPAAAVSPGDAGVSSPLRRAGAAGAAAARVRFGARREDSRGR